MFSNALSEIDELDLAGFKIVRSEMFSPIARKVNPTCTLWPSKIGFNRVALQALNNCEYVMMQVNPETKCLLVMPVHSKDKDSIRWVRGQKEITSRTMESKLFGNELYKTWALDPTSNYRVSGRLVSVRNKVVLLFDFSTAEKWHSQVKTNSASNA